jgi:hypothetical protein
MLGLLFINFGEPDEPTTEKVTSFLERIFLRNASLEGHTDEAAVARSRELARARAPGLLEAYEAIGGSPMNAQSARQAESLCAELVRRGVRARVYTAFQFTDPSVAECVARARSDGVETLIAVPGYPLCGQSTTAAALEDVRSAIVSIGWQMRLLALAGWHHHADYVRMQAHHIRDYVKARGLDLGGADTILTAPTISLIALCAISSASSISGSGISLADASTITIASEWPATTRSRRDSVRRRTSPGIRTKRPSRCPTRIAPSGLSKGMLLTCSAAKDAIIARMSAGCSPS